MLHRSTLVITSFSALALVVLVIWAKERGPTTEPFRASVPMPVISHYAPPGPAASEPTGNQDKPWEKKDADPIPAEPARLSQDDRRPLEIAPVPTSPPPTGSPIQLTGGSEPASPPQAGTPPLDPKPATPLSAPPIPAEPSPIPAIPAPAQTPPTPVPQPIAIKCPWVLRMEIIDGRPRLEAKSETATEMRIDCDKLSLRSPDGDIEATGKVSVMAGTLEGSCDRLVLTWSDSKITLSGKVQLKGKQDEQSLELNAEGVSMKLSQILKKDGIVPTSYPAPAQAPQPVVPSTPPLGAPTAPLASPPPYSPVPSPPMPVSPVPISPLPRSAAPTPAPLTPTPEASPPSNPNSSTPPGAAATPKLPTPAVAESRSFGNGAIPAVKESRAAAGNR